LQRKLLKIAKAASSGIIDLIGCALQGCQQFIAKG
jgi:hypothetical protein